MKDLIFGNVKFNVENEEAREFVKNSLKHYLGLDYDQFEVTRLNYHLLLATKQTVEGTEVDIVFENHFHHAVYDENNIERKISSVITDIGWLGFSNRNISPSIIEETYDEVSGESHGLEIISGFLHRFINSICFYNENMNQYYVKLLIKGLLRNINKNEVIALSNVLTASINEALLCTITGANREKDFEKIASLTKGNLNISFLDLLAKPLQQDNSKFYELNSKSKELYRKFIE